ncbi:MAG: hypothetical protein J6D13_05835, partial [Clostridium sp.]|nr:hypothetical protein [Clostridium sp.]
MKKNMLKVLTVAVLTGALLGGCGSGSASESQTAASEPSQTADTAVADTQGDSVEKPITIRSCFNTGMTGAVNNFAIEKGLYKELGIEFENV